jgi:hypothetical protein
MNAETIKLYKFKKRKIFKFLNFKYKRKNNLIYNKMQIYYFM